MKDKRILYVSSEVVPYLPETEIASTAFNVAKKAHSKGVQTRIFMPRFGVINERRHQLHEVIRLSGMNLIINDMDMPLIIKVASIPKERMQVYFIDNDEYFKRKAIFSDEDDQLFSDNDERAIFFAKGVVETVKKLNWAPDIIHVHGWMASLLPLYIKEYYKDDYYSVGFDFGKGTQAGYFSTKDEKPSWKKVEIKEPFAKTYAETLNLAKDEIYFIDMSKALDGNSSNFFKKKSKQIVAGGDGFNPKKDNLYNKKFSEMYDGLIFIKNISLPTNNLIAK